MKTQNLYQTMPLSKFNEGSFAGVEDLGTLRKQGNFGLGIFDHLDGEMFFLDGVVYQVKADGQVVLPSDALTTPFALTTFFEPEEEIGITKPMSQMDLESLLNSKFHSPYEQYAIKITGKFDPLRVRSFPRQKKPFRPIYQAVMSQKERDLSGMTGTFVGFRLASTLVAFTVDTHYHFNFLSNDKKTGGHVLNYRIQSGKIEIMKLGRVVTGSGYS